MVVDTPDRRQLEVVGTLLDRVRAASGYAALSESKERELLRLGRPGGEPAAGSFVTMVLIGADPRGAPDGTLVGYAQLDAERARGRFVAEAVVDPGASDPGRTGDRLVGTLAGEARRRGGRSLRLWAPRATVEDDERARRHGFVEERTLLQMRCPLPLGDGPPAAGPGADLAIRRFVPGRDEAAWLATNNRAFAGHPEQGHWDLDTLRSREQEPWFDPDGLLLLEADGRVAGSCWTKIHRDTEPPMGEIYVIGVDPDYHGRGWGRTLTRAGLDWLAGRGLTVGMLYVDADNRAAVGLYRSMGFVEDHADRAYVLDLTGR